MKLIMNVYNPADVGGFLYAFVELTPELAKLIMRRRDVFVSSKSQEQLVAMEYRDCSAVFLSSLPEDMDTSDLDAGGDFEPTILNREDFDELVERTDCNRMVVTDDSVYWTAYPHHSDRALTVETNPINYATVEEAAQAPVV